MHYKQETNSLKNAMYGLLIAIFGILFFCYTSISTMNYVEIDAIYMGNTSYRNNSQGNHIYREKFQIEYNGQKQIIIRQTEHPIRASKGEMVKIEVNPKNPNKIKDTGDLIYGFLLFLVGLIYGGWNWITHLCEKREYKDSISYRG